MPKDSAQNVQQNKNMARVLRELNMKKCLNQKIDHKLMEKLCQFAGFELNSNEQERFLSAIQSIVDWITIVKDINTSSIQEEYKNVEHTLKLHSDLVQPDVIKEDLLRLVPKKSQDFVMLPKLR